MVKRVESVQKVVQKVAKMLLKSGKKWSESDQKAVKK